MSISSERRVPVKDSDRARSGSRLDTPEHFVRCFLRIGMNALLTMVILSSIAARLPAQSKVSIRTYPTDQAGRITAGPDGALWFTETVAGKIGRITTSGVITEYAIPTANSYPYGITTGPDGAVWFTEVNAQKIGRITTDGLVTEYPAGGAPSTSFLSEIRAGPDGALWFNKWCTGISRITITGEITDYPTASCPTAITTGPDDALWFSDAAQIVGRITVEGTLSQYPLPKYSLHSITTGPDKALWFTGDVPTFSGPVSPTIGRITTGGAITKYVLQAKQGFPFLITSGPDGALWFTNPYDNYSVGRMTTNGVSSVIPIGGPCRYPYNPFNGIVLAGPDLWFACSNGGIVQITPHVTITTLASSLNPSIYGQKVTWAAMVTTSGSVTPTGTVAFRWSNSGRVFTIGTATLNPSGVATLTRSNLNADPFGEPYPIVAVYSGDASNLGSASSVLSQHVLQSKTVATMTSSANPSIQGQAVTFAATITSPTVIVTGPVTFSVGSSILGTAQLSGGVAKFTTAALPVGSNTVKVAYSGNSNVARSSASLVQTVH